jgi:hypothetical protein
MGAASSHRFGRRTPTPGIRAAGSSVVQNVPVVLVGVAVRFGRTQAMFQFSKPVLPLLPDFWS